MILPTASRLAVSEKKMVFKKKPKKNNKNKGEDIRILIPEDSKHTVLAVAGCNGFPVDGVIVALCFPGGERY